jgi:site-specific recombinase XerD
MREAKRVMDVSMETRETSLPDLIALYLEACAAEGKSPKTLTAYRETLSLYLRITRAEGLPLDAREVTPADVYRYITAVRRRGVCDSTQHRRHREVKHFFSWLRRMEIVVDNPFQRVPLIRLEQKIVQPFTAEEVGRLLAACDRTSYFGSRNRAITMFLLDSGVRASELTGLDLDDVDVEHGRARVLNGKGRKQRVVAFGPQVGEALSAYLEFRGESAGPLFQTQQGGRMLAQGLIVMYQRLGTVAGVEHVHPHRFRHTFATMAIRAAAREIDVQHLLGHSTSAMVRRYTRTYDAENAAAAHASFSPVAQLGRP